jgi:ribosomal protein S27E
MSVNYNGKEYKSKRALCRELDVSFARLEYYICKRNTTLEDAVTIIIDRKNGLNEGRAIRCRDHKGNVFSSVGEMLTHYEVGYGRYARILAAGFGLEQALTFKGHLQIITDPKGIKHLNKENMCKAWGQDEDIYEQNRFRFRGSHNKIRWLTHKPQVYSDEGSGISLGYESGNLQVISHGSVCSDEQIYFICKCKNCGHTINRTLKQLEDKLGCPRCECGVHKYIAGDTINTMRVIGTAKYKPENSSNSSKALVVECQKCKNMQMIHAASLRNNKNIKCMACGNRGIAWDGETYYSAVAMYKKYDPDGQIGSKVLTKFNNGNLTDKEVCSIAIGARIDRGEQINPLLYIYTKYPCIGNDVNKRYLYKQGVNKYYAVKFLSEGTYAIMSAIDIHGYKGEELEVKFDSYIWEKRD